MNNKLAPIKKTQLLLELPTTQLLDNFGAGKPSPGSGSATALLGLLSAKMILTVCEISLRKNECISTHKEFRYIKDQIETKIEPKLKSLFEKDAQDFEKIVALRGLRDKTKKSSEKSRYSRESLSLLETTTDYIFEVSDIAISLIEYGIIVFENGWRTIRGDSGVAISTAMSSLMSSIFIINLNLKTLKHRSYAPNKLQDCQDLQKKLEFLQAKAFSYVVSIASESLESIQLELLSEKA